MSTVHWAANLLCLGADKSDNKSKYKHINKTITFHILNNIYYVFIFIFWIPASCLSLEGLIASKCLQSMYLCHKSFWL